MKEYKINAPKMTNIKRVFVAKGHAVPEDILDGIQVNRETVTHWEDTYDNEVVNSDDIATHFTGKWNYEIAELSNVQGHISIEPQYTFDFPMDMVIIDYAPEDQLSVKTAVYSMKLAGNKTFQDLSANYAPCLISEISMNSANCLSDIVLSNMTFTDPDFSLESLPDNMLYIYDSAIGTASASGFYVAGNFDEVSEMLSDATVDGLVYDFDYEAFNSKLADARNMLLMKNYDVALSAHPSYRSMITPRYQKFYDLSVGIDLPQNAQVIYSYFNHWTIGAEGEFDWYSPHITIMDGEKPLYKTPMFIHERDFIDVSLFTDLKTREKFKIYAAANGNVLSNMIVYGADGNSRITVNGIEQTLDDFVNSTVSCNTEVKFIPEPIGQAVNYFAVKLDRTDIPANANEIDLTSRDYIETVLFMNCYPVDPETFWGSHPADLTDVYFTTNTSVDSGVHGPYPEKYEFEGYQMAGLFVDLDNPTEFITELDPEKIGTPTNIAVVYVKNT